MSTVAEVLYDMGNAAIAMQLARKQIEVLSETNVKLRSENQWLKERVRYLEAVQSQREEMTTV